MNDEKLDCASWRPVVGYEESYIVSDQGEVRSLDRIDSSGHFRKGKVKKQTVRHGGYLSVSLCKNGACKGHKVHRLVAEAFIPNPDNKPQVNHINEIKTDNRVENLEWATCQENCNHGDRNKKIQRTKGHPVIGVSIHDDTCVEFPSVQSANMAFASCRGSGNVGKCIRGEVSTAYGYVWKLK